MTWKKVRLDDILTARTERYKPNDNAIFGLSRIDKIDFSGNIFVSNKSSNTDMILVKKDDLVISGINVAKGAMSVYQGNDDILATIHYSSYILDENQIDIEYFCYYLKSSLFKQTLTKQVSGGIKTEIKPNIFLSLVIQIPATVMEQKNIVKYLRTKLSIINTLITEQSQKIKLIHNIRHQLLTEAMNGSLSIGWRKNNPCLISAIELFMNIKSEKEQQIKQKKRKADKTLSLISEKEIPFELPKGWVWCKLGEIISFGPTNGFSPKENKKGTGIKCLSLTATTSGFFRDGYYKYVDEQISSDSYLWLVKNDILLQRGNSIEYVGIAAIYEGEANQYIYPDLMIKIQVPTIISSKYIYYVLLAPFNRKYFSSKSSGTQKSMPKINQNVVLNTLIPLPSLAEQNIIVEKLTMLLNKCNQLQFEIENQSQYIKDYPNALFNESFEGINAVEN